MLEFGVDGVGEGKTNSGSVPLGPLAGVEELLMDDTFFGSYE